MKLDTYLRETNTTEQALADACGVTQPTINRVRRGESASMALMTKIVAATNGAVTPNDFLPDIAPAEPQEAS